MGLKCLIFLFITFPYIIYGMKYPIKYAIDVAILDKYAKNKTTIANNNLILIEKGFLGEGGSGFVYAGKMVKTGHPVAIKFVPKTKRTTAEYELVIYKQLNAYKNPKIEDYGIPNVYYHGKWESFILTAITKLDQSFEDIQKIHPILPLDMMILFRDFVIQSGYMHAHRISHGDIHSDNIMLCSNRSFLTDFDESDIMEDEETFKPTHDDWKGFIYMTIEHYDISFMGSWYYCKNELQKHNLDEGLLRIIKKFGDEAFSTVDAKKNPNYDRLKEFINKEIIKKHGNSRSPPKFSWVLS